MHYSKVSRTPGPPHVRIHQGLLSRPTAQILSLCGKPLGPALQIPPEADISNEKNLQRESGTYTSITTPSPRRSQSSRLLTLHPVRFPGLGLKGTGTDGDVSGSSGRKRGPAGRWVRTDQWPSYLSDHHGESEDAREIV